MVGGDIKGSQILGQYPESLNISSPLNLDRGRFLPSHSWEAVWNGIASWFGVATADMDQVLPNVGNFIGDQLFTNQQMFK